MPLICFQDTFVRAKNWVKELQRQASPNIVIALAGNKADLATKRAVDFQVSGGQPSCYLSESGKQLLPLSGGDGVCPQNALKGRELKVYAAEDTCSKGAAGFPTALAALVGNSCGEQGLQSTGCCLQPLLVP